VDIGQTRTADLAEYYPYNEDDYVSIEVQGAAEGMASHETTAAVATNSKGTATPDLVLALTAQSYQVEGWNLFALAVEPDAPYTASTLAADINSQGGNVTQVFRWNAVAGDWAFYLVDSGYGTDFAIKLGEAYVLKNLAPVTWTYRGRCPSMD